MFSGFSHGALGGLLSSLVSYFTSIVGFPTFTNFSEYTFRHFLKVIDNYFLISKIKHMFMITLY